MKKTRAIPHGVVENVATGHVKGWALDLLSRRPARIRVLLNNDVIGEGTTMIERADIRELAGVDYPSGFRIELKSKISDHDLSQIVVQCSRQDAWITIPRLGHQKKRKRRSYQDFDGTGSSKSHEKLAALRLELIERVRPGAQPLEGKSVLDLGCNEGFFCMEAVRQGAKRVVGIDMNKSVIQSAAQNCPKATFIQGSWWDIPNEKFDVIFLLSAIHYEPNQMDFLTRLHSHLEPKGVLVLECGVIRDLATASWRAVRRWDGIKRYPTTALLMRDLLSDYAVRPIGKSVDQAGDPVERFVFHCSPFQATALILSGRSRTGKSSLAFKLNQGNIPTYSTDRFLVNLLAPLSKLTVPLSDVLITEFGRRAKPNLALVSKFIVNRNLADEFCELMTMELPVESGVFCIEGEILRYNEILKSLKPKLATKGVRMWVATPL